MFDFEQMAQWKILKQPAVEAALAKAGFVQMLRWKLLRGSHDFPGPDGGACINEAAIVAAGYAYRAVKSANDCPPCFSRPCAAYALALNDYIDDDRYRRRRLMPFVTRLAGSADRPAVERERAALILQRTITDLLLPRFARYPRHPVAEACRRVQTPSRRGARRSLPRGDHAGGEVRRASGAGNGAHGSAESGARHQPGVRPRRGDSRRRAQARQATSFDRRRIGVRARAKARGRARVPA